MAGLKSFADHRDNGTEVFARGELGHYAAVLRVNIKLRGDDAGSNVAAVLDHRRSGLVAGAFNPEDKGRIQLVA